MSTPTVRSSPEEQELRDKVTRLVETQFKMDWVRAFDHYAVGTSATVDRERLLAMLEDAGIGNFMTRGKWADALLEKLDTNGDKRISWGEFESVLRVGR
ncbi:MAG: EF-hand domain-containing protein [Deltaproteobacteria bacterium]|nr:EF-hand domain-containing protein [Deltaproteobacteria bacterium]